MSPRQTLLIASTSVVVYDAIASFASIALGFRYAVASIGSLALYAAIGAFAARTKNRSFGFAAGAVAGLSDATAGWGISWLIGPGRPPSGMLGVPQWLITVAIVTVLASIVAGAAGIFGTIGRSRVQT
jgi:hypothetical protein